jgi:hypothetical protein
LAALARAKPRLFLVGLTIALAAAAATPRNARGQISPGTITVFADQLGSECTLEDHDSRALRVYVLHTSSTGAIESMFKVSPSLGFAAAYVGETVNASAFSGNTQTGLAVRYNECIAGTFVIATIDYMGAGQSANCSYLEVVAHPLSPTGYIDIIDCYFGMWGVVTLGKLLVNPTAGNCTPWCTVSTRQSTWGAVKALYR